ncbi:MAG: hypothetical protein IIZ06_03680 [Kiritimatiellae bacterium]|nr:hypothetical protein [Kiritimatiellia bacterium]
MAKFKVGDTAFVFDDWDSPYDGRGGTVVKVDRYVHVKFRDGKVAQFSEDELTKTTNAVRNAVDEAGRPLRQENIQGFKDADGKLIKVGDMLEDTVGTTKGKRSKVVGFKGTQIYLDSGWKISKSNAALTRIVNSRAANADEWIGKTVEVKGVYWLTMGAVKAGTKFKVVEKNPNGGYDLKNLSGGAGMKGVFPKLMVVSNAARSRNAIVQKALNACAKNGAMAALDSSEKSKIKSIASGMPCSFMDGGDSLSGVIKHSKRPFLYIDFDVSKSEIDGKPYYEWYVHAWNRTRKWERNGGQYKIEDAVSAAAQAMRGAKQMIEKWAGGVPLNADTSVLRETAVNAKFKVGDRVGIRNYNGTTWYAKIVSIKSPSEYLVDGIGKSSGLHMDVDEVEIKYVLKKDADGDLVYTPVNSVSNGVGVFDGAYVVERTSRDGKFKVYLVNSPNKKPLAEFATREEAERFVADMEKKQSS